MAQNRGYTTTPLIMVRVRVNGSNKHPYRVKARVTAGVVLTRQNIDPG